MLTEQLVASLDVPRATTSTTAARDASILTYEVQPLQAQRETLKKSATSPNCLATSPSHIYAAQADKAIVNVYNRQKNSLEAVVPFKEKVTCLALACSDTLLVMGTETGRLYLWETHSGRQLSTPQAHLQAVSAIVVNPFQSSILSASLDATIHLWSLQNLVSVSPPPASIQHTRNSPLRTLSTHRDAITSLALGHAASFCNFCISASRDKTCVIWDFNSDTILRTILLSATPLCISLDPADRAVYVGYDDGSIHNISLVDAADSTKSISDASTRGSTFQTDASKRWIPPASDSVQAALCMCVSYDGTILTTGHASGKILSWSIPTGTFASTLTPVALSGAVTNLYSLPPTGFVNPRTTQAFIQHAVVKPRFGEFDLGQEGLGEGYTVNVQFTSSLDDTDEELESASNGYGHGAISDFERSLTHTSFPADVLEASIVELATWTNKSSAEPKVLRGSVAELTTHKPEMQSGKSEDYMSLDADLVPNSKTKSSLQSTKHQKLLSKEQNDVLAHDAAEMDSSGVRDVIKENARLKEQVAALQRVQKATFAQMDALRRRAG